MRAADEQLSVHSAPRVPIHTKAVIRRKARTSHSSGVQL